MRNKKTIMIFSALSILIFHLWVNITNTRIEMYLKHICVVGVDLFFFVSAYSIANRKKIEYKKFIVDRFINIYLKFILFAIIGALYLKWSGSKFIKTILGVELFTKGGGSFLWFIPGIMIVYLILPLYKKMDEKYPKVVPFIMIATYLLASIAISTFTSYDEIFILTNRIPIILIGYYFAKYDIFSHLNAKKNKYIVLTSLLLILGTIISYMVYINHFNVSWFKETTYILYIPLSIGLILLLDKIKINKVFLFIGSITLEMYGLQMIFGFKIANEIFKFTNVKILSNILTITVLIVMSLITKKVLDMLSFKKRKVIK